MESPVVVHLRIDVLQKIGDGDRRLVRIQLDFEIPLFGLERDAEWPLVVGAGGVRHGNGSEGNEQHKRTHESSPPHGLFE